MDVKEFIRNKGKIEIKNPNYNPKSKYNTEPATISVPDINSSDPAVELARRDAETSRYVLDKDVKKYREYGLNWNPYDNMDAELAAAQSNWTKAGNALAQTLVSEIGLGTLKTFSDLTDFIIGGAIRTVTGSDNDYSNSVSEFLEKKQEDFRNFAPIYTTPGVSIDNGGLTDASWWFSNIPSIASNITLLIPGRAASVGVSKLGKLAKTTKIGKKASISSRRFLGNVLGGQTKLARAQQMAKYGLEGTVMRIAENYQESRQTYNELYPEAYKTLDRMSDDEYQHYVDTHKDILGEDLDYADKSAVAKRIASYGADETFKSDMSNAIFDIYQIYGLRNMGRIMNAPARASVRRLDKLSRKFPNKSKDDLQEILKNRSKLQKALDATKDITRGSFVTITGQLSEGVEEAVNYAAQQEGLTYGQALLHRGFDEATGTYNLSKSDKDELERKGFFSKDRLLPFSRLTSQALADYIKAPELHDAAFWGVLGGIAFSAGGAGINNISNKYKARSLKEELRKKGVDESQLDDYVTLIQTPEIKARISNIESRHIKWEELKGKLKSIKKGIDPNNTDRSLETQEEQDEARRRAIEDHDISLLLASMDVGHWNITKAYLESDGVRDALVEAGILSEEDAKARQQEIRTLANKIEKLYNDNLKTIDSALTNFEDDEEDLSEIPVEVFNLVARYNIAHRIAADRLQEDINKLNTEKSKEEDRVKPALEGTGFNVKQLVKTRVQAQALGELLAQRKEIANSSEASTLVGQMALDKLDAKIALVKKDIMANVTTEEDYARAMDAFRFAHGVRKNEDGYYIDPYDEEFKKIDEAIVNNDLSYLDSIGINGVLNLQKTTQEDENTVRFDYDKFNKAKDALEVLDNAYEMLYNTDTNRTVANLKDISAKLHEDYHTLSALELQRNIELSEIALTKEEVATRVDEINNTMKEVRVDFLNFALEGLQQLAKKYGKDNIIDELNNIVKNKPKGATYLNFTDNERKFFNDYVSLMGLDKSLNRNLYNRAVKAIQLNDIYEFTKDSDMFDEMAETTENSSTSENQESADKSKEPIKTSSETSKKATKPKTPKIEENEEETTPKAKVAKVTLKANITPENPSGLTINPVAEDEVGVDALEDENGNTTLDFKNAEDGALEDWMRDENLWDITGDEKAKKDKNATYEVVKNPIVRKTDNGIEVIEKGTLNATLSSTGEREQPVGPVKKTIDGEEDSAARAAEFTSDDLGVDIANAIMAYIVSNDTYNYNEVAKYLRETFKDRDQARLESLLEKFITDPNTVELAETVNRKIEAVPISKIISFSALNDVLNNQEAKQKVKNLLNAAFKDLLNDYAKHSALDFDKTNGKYILSLENLLRYCVSVTENKNDADRLYSALLDVINSSDEYVAIDKYNPVSEVIANAKKEYEQRKEELADAHNATSINIKGYIGRLLYKLNNDNTSESDKQKIKQQLEEIYDVLDNAKPGDVLTHVNQSGNNQSGIDFFLTNSKGIDVKVSEIPTPESVNGGTHWQMKNMGWLTDVPKGNGSSKFQKVITRMLVPDENDVVGNKINSLLREYVSSNGNKNIAEEIIKLIRSDSELAERLAAKVASTSDVSAVKHLADLYKYVKQINDMFLQTYGLTQEQAEEALRDNRLESIQNWMNKLKVSYNNAEYLHNSPNVPITIQSIAEGNAIITDTQIPVSQAVGSEHKGLVHLGIVTFDNPGEITIAGGPSVKNNFGRVGTPILTIAGNHGAVAQIQVTTQAMNSSNFENNSTIQAIQNDVFNELEKHINKWGETHDDAELLHFLRRLLDRTYGNNTPLFMPWSYRTQQGVSVEPLTGGYKGFQLVYTTEDGKTHYTKFFSSQTVDGNTYSVSNIRFEIKNQSGTVRGISMNPNTRNPEERAKALKTLKEHLKETLRFNLDFAYINSDNSNLPIQGFATRKDGKFVINITGEKEYTFNSFNDFVLENDIINAATAPNAQGRNFNRPGEGGFMDSNGLTYTIDSSDSSSTPLEETTTKRQPTTKKGDVLSKVVSDALSKTLFGELKSNNKKNLSKEILKVLLNGKQLNILNNSGIITKLLHKNVIFVEDYNGLTYVDSKGVERKVPDTAKAAYHKTAVTYKRPDGTELTIAADTIVLSSRWVELANGTMAEQEQAARDILHENLHRVLTFPENAGWATQAQQLLEAFVNAELTDENDIKVRDVYSKLNLEEFLVESITRPELMRVLNKIPTESPIGGKAKLKKGNLLQRILTLIGKLFGIDINENSLLEKEFKLFEELGKTSETKETVTESKDTKININDVTETTNEGQDMEDIDFSTVPDITVSSKDSIEFKLENDSRVWYNNALANGLINIICK